MYVNILVMLIAGSRAYGLIISNFTSSSANRLIKGKPLTLTWLFQTNVDEAVVLLNLYIDDNYDEIYASQNGLTETGVKEWQGRKFKVDVDRTSHFKVDIPSLEYEDEHKFILEVVIRIGVGPESKKKSEWVNIEVTNITGAPEFCVDPDPTKILAPENQSFDVNITLCGKPKPKVSGDFLGKTKMLHGILVDKKRKMYSYKYGVRSLNRTHCGKEITFDVKGLTNFTVTSNLIIQFKPTVPVITATSRSDNKTVVSWKKENIGTCSYNYTITYTDENSSVIETFIGDRTEFYDGVPRFINGTTSKNYSIFIDSDDQSNKLITDDPNIFRNAAFIKIQVTFNNLKAATAPHVIKKPNPTNTATNNNNEKKTGTETVPREQNYLPIIIIASTLIFLIAIVFLVQLAKTRYKAKTLAESPSKYPIKNTQKTKTNSGLDIYMSADTTLLSERKRNSNDSNESGFIGSEENEFQPYNLKGHRTNSITEV